MAERRNIYTGRPSEVFGGFSRVVRIENPASQILVAGTASTNPDSSVYAPGDHYAQTKHILVDLIGEHLKRAGALLKDVVRTRIYVVDIQNHGDEVSRAHGEVFGGIGPVETMIGVEALARPDMLVEIDADAVV